MIHPNSEAATFLTNDTHSERHINCGVHWVLTKVFPSRDNSRCDISFNSIDSICRRRLLNNRRSLCAVDPGWGWI